MKKSERVRIELTPAPKKKVQEVSSEEITTLEFTAKELEERIAPRAI